MSALKILIVEDESAIADTLVYALQAEGFVTQWFNLAGPALDHLQAYPVALVVLDVGLPDINGFEMCRRLRKFSDVPVIFLTARGEEVDRIVGLEIGADDYVVKPFSPREVAARVRAVLKRVPPAPSGNFSPSHSDGVFFVDTGGLRIFYRQQPLILTRHEFLLLQHFLSQPGRVFTREQLLQATGIAPDVGYERNVDGHIKSLRAKLRQIAPAAEPLQTHRGFGYSYEPTRA